MEETDSKTNTSGTGVSIAPMSQAEIDWRLDERKALALSKATVAVPKHFAGKPGDIMATFIMADELGVSRMAALRSMYVVNGKVQLSGDLLLAIARANGVKVREEYHDDSDPEDPNPKAICAAILPDGQECVQTYTRRDAERAGLWNSNDVWRKYPQRMLQMRARGWCLRDAIPDKLAGVYAEGEIIDVTPLEVRE